MVLIIFARVEDSCSLIANGFFVFVQRSNYQVLLCIWLVT